LRHDTGAFLKELDASQQAMAAGERKRLSEYATALRCDVTTLSTTLRTARQTMSAEQEQRTSEHLAGLRHSVDTLCNNASAFMKELDASHEAMTAQQQQWLGAERVRLAADVATLRAGFRAAQNQLRTDHREAQRLWSWLGKLMKQRRAAQPT
jgi:chromosome segregation ATPase